MMIILPSSSMMSGSFSYLGNVSLVIQTFLLHNESDVQKVLLFVELVWCHVMWVYSHLLLVTVLISSSISHDLIYNEKLIFVFDGTSLVKH